jgi:hypothetical protein
MQNPQLVNPSYSYIFLAPGGQAHATVSPFDETLCRRTIPSGTFLNSSVAPFSLQTMCPTCQAAPTPPVILAPPAAPLPQQLTAAQLADRQTQLDLESYGDLIHIAQEHGRLTIEVESDEDGDHFVLTSDDTRATSLAFEDATFELRIALCTSHTDGCTGLLEEGEVACPNACHGWQKAHA